jgi:hypothetical protein
VPLFLTSALDGSEWSASRSDRFTPREGARTTHWMAPRGGLNSVEKIKISCQARELNSGHPAHSLSVYRLRYPSSLLFLYTLYPAIINNGKPQLDAALLN